MRSIVTPSFIKYLLAGISTVLLDFLTLIACKWAFMFSAAAAVGINQIFIWLYNFYLNKYWTFKNKDLPHKQFIRYVILASLNYLMAVALMYVFSDKLGFHYLSVRFSTIAGMTLWNYFIYKFWVYA